MAQYAFYFDSDKCTGCKTCQVACKECYKLPVSNLYRKVLNYQGGSWELNEAGSYVPNGVFGYFVSMACNHCVDPACVANCPRTASYGRTTTCASAARRAGPCAPTTRRRTAKKRAT